MAALAPAPESTRTGSPIIEPGLLPALLTTALAGMLAASTLGGRAGLALAVAVLQVLTSAGWFRLNGMWPARQGIALAALAGLAADAAVLAGGGAGGLIGVLGISLVLVLVLQTFRPSDPSERFYALTVLGSGAVLSGLCAALLLSRHVPAALLAVAVTVLVAVLPGRAAVVGALVLGGAAGVLAGAPALVAALAAVGALVGRRVASYDFPSRFVHLTAGVALPLAIAAPLIRLLA